MSLNAELKEQAMEHIFGQPMMLQDGEEHRRTRRLMAPAFHGKAIANYFDIMQTEVNKSLENWVEGSPISIKNEFNQLALRIGIRLLLGVQLQSEVEQVEQLYNTLTQGALALLRLDIPFTKVVPKMPVVNLKLFDKILSVSANFKATYRSLVKY